jgi:non-specific serine/threonine protein kinase
MWCYWLLAGSLSAGRYWLERGLDLVQEPGDTRMSALWVVSMLALRQGDSEAAKPGFEECERLARQLGDETARACAIRTAGVAEFSTGGDPERGLSLLEEALALHRAAGDLASLAFSLYYAAAYHSTMAPARAAVLGEELLSFAEDHHAMVTRGYAQFVVAIAAWNLGDRRRAEELMREDAEFRGRINDRWGLTQSLEILAWTACARGAHDRATWLLGAAHALWQTVGSSPTRLSYHAHWHEHCKQESLRALGKRAFTVTFRAGAKAEVHQAVAYAITDD